MSGNIIEGLADAVTLLEHWRFLRCLLLAVLLGCVLWDALPSQVLRIVASVVVGVGGIWLGAVWERRNR